VRPLAATLLLALVAIGCGGAAPDPGFRVDLPPGWEDRTPEYRERFEEGMNAQAPRWARVDFDGIWEDARGRTVMMVARLTEPSGGPLDTLARRMIRLSNGAITSFELDRGPTGVTVDGARGVIYDYRGTPPFGRVAVRVALIRHEEELHIASMTTSPEHFQRGAARMADVLASWRWV
jgi:hypothetical protein